MKYNFYDNHLWDYKDQRFPSDSSSSVIIDALSKCRYDNVSIFKIMENFIRSTNSNDYLDQLYYALNLDNREYMRYDSKPVNKKCTLEYVEEDASWVVDVLNGKEQIWFDTRKGVESFLLEENILTVEWIGDSDAPEFSDNRIVVE